MAYFRIMNLKHKYGNVEALRGVDLQINNNEKCIAMIGSNGAGKSTLVNAVTGLITGWDGEIEFQGKSIRCISTPNIVKMGIVQCPERRFLFDYMTVKDNLLLGSYNVGKDAKIKINYVFELFPILKERLNQRVFSLSGGEAQMVAIGRSLLANPKLLILDEPTLGLAPIIRKKLIDAFNIIKETQNIVIFLVEQNVKVSFDVAERIYCIREGRIAKEAPTEEMIKDKEIIETFLGV